MIRHAVRWRTVVIYYLGASLAVSGVHVLRVFA